MARLSLTCLSLTGLSARNSISPLYGTRDLGARGSARSIDSMFTEAFSRGHQLLCGDPRAALHLACGLMLRGNVVASDVTRNVERLRKDLRMISWNEYGMRFNLWLLCNADRIDRAPIFSMQASKLESVRLPRYTKTFLCLP